ncbi:MAG: hypothetical protein JRF56_10180 [Deltaproteobacteria bacterium]|jgi:hypothetical protein|nr:hypothetical protein [Deltaproteobacteria bacterium]
MEEAAGKVKTLSIDNKKDLLKHKGLSIVELWEVRDAIYKIKPVIKRDFVTEYSNDKQRYERTLVIYIEKRLNQQKLAITEYPNQERCQACHHYKFS